MSFSSARPASTPLRVVLRRATQDGPAEAPSDGVHRPGIVASSASQLTASTSSARAPPSAPAALPAAPAPTHAVYGYWLAHTDPSIPPRFVPVSLITTHPPLLPPPPQPQPQLARMATWVGSSPLSAPSETKPAVPTAAAAAKQASRQHQNGLLTGGRAGAPLPEEHKTGIEANWEVAYIYAFLIKFTTMRSVNNPASILQSPMDLEKALLASSPGAPTAVVGASTSASGAAAVKVEEPNGTATLANGDKARRESSASSLSSIGSASSGLSSIDSLSSLSSGGFSPIKEEAVQHFAPAKGSGPVPPESALIVNIVKCFHTYCLSGTAAAGDKRGKEPWFRFLTSWLDARVEERLQNKPSYGITWTVNPLKGQIKVGQEKEEKDSKMQEKWWLLSWEDKARVLRSLIDYQLQHAQDVRGQVESHYNIVRGKSMEWRPEENILLLPPLGQHDRRTFWSFDDSPRVYVSYNPYKRNTPFHTMSSTVGGLEAFIKALPGPRLGSSPDDAAATSTAPQKNGDSSLWDHMNKSSAAASKAEAAKKEKGKGKGKAAPAKGLTEDQRDLLQLKEKLEEKLIAARAYEEALVALDEKRRKQVERAAAKEARVARSMKQLELGISSGLTRSTRLRTTRKVDYNMDTETEDDASPMKKRKMVIESDEESDGQGEWEADEADSGSAGEGPSRRNGGRQMREDNGLERRSKRIKETEVAETRSETNTVSSEPAENGWTRRVAPRIVDSEGEGDDSRAVSDIDAIVDESKEGSSTSPSEANDAAEQEEMDEE